MSPKERTAVVEDVVAPANSATVPTFTRKEVKARPELVIVGDEVYNAKRFQHLHPGGAIFVSMFGGRDATEAFMEYHTRTFPKAVMKDYYVGRLATSETPVEYDADYLELSKQVRKALPPGGGFAPKAYWYKCALIAGSSMAVEAYLYFVERTLLGSVLLGWIFALIGLNIQHDANHGTLSRNGKVNWGFGLFQDWIGGSSILWLQEHVVGHHLHTNDTELDPDITAAAPAIHLNPKEPHLPWYSFQHLYVFPGLSAYGLKLVFLDLVELVRYQWVGDKISALANYMYLPSILMKFAFYARFIVFPLLKAPTLHTVACIFTVIFVTAGYLGTFFVISHNFDGVKHLGPGGTISRTDSFIKRQAETSANVGGKALAVLHGGLNYQIEHHLFPRIHHAHYHTISPTVRAFLEKKGITYKHYDSVLVNLKDMVLHLYKLGRPDGKFSLMRMYQILGMYLFDPESIDKLQ